MWFKQARLFELKKHLAFDPEALDQKLASFIFTPCLPSLPVSLGWVPPISNEQALVASIDGCMLICLQFEEKILPATVVRQQLHEKIKTLNEQHEKINTKKRQALKEEITQTLLTKAFSKLTPIYAYIDTKNRWLLVNSVHPKKVEAFISLFKRNLEIDVATPEIKKPAAILTQWLSTQRCPSHITIEKACVLQDPNQKNRIIRAKQQNLSAVGIQSLLNDGCAVQQLSLSWQDQVYFTLTEDFSLRCLRFQEDTAHQSEESETLKQKFMTNLLIMSKTLSTIFTQLLAVFAEQKTVVNS